MTTGVRLCAAGMCLVLAGIPALAAALIALSEVRASVSVAERAFIEERTNAEIATALALAAAAAASFNAHPAIHRGGAEADAEMALARIEHALLSGEGRPGAILSSVGVGEGWADAAWAPSLINRLDLVRDRLAKAISATRNRAPQTISAAGTPALATELTLLSRAFDQRAQALRREIALRTDQQRGVATGGLSAALGLLGIGLVAAFAVAAVLVRRSVLQPLEAVRQGALALAERQVPRRDWDTLRKDAIGDIARALAAIAPPEAPSRFRPRQLHVAPAALVPSEPVAALGAPRGAAQGAFQSATPSTRFGSA
ncbi:MAG: hypothetical protein AAGF45_03670 [Pseudomonadota bacterium]